MEKRLAGLRLNQRQLKAVAHIVKRGRITRREYERLTATPVATAKRDLGDLIKKGVLKKHGSARNAWYEMAIRKSAQMSR